MNSIYDIEEKLNIDIYQLVCEILQEPEIKEALIAYNQDQLKAGKDSKNQDTMTSAAKTQRLGFVYAKKTVEIKAKKGQPYDKVTLKDTGDFYKSMDVSFRQDETEIIANFKKGADNIMINFDSDFDPLGITDDNKEALTWLDLLPLLRKKLRLILGLE